MLVQKWVMVWKAWTQFPPDSEVSTRLRSFCFVTKCWLAVVPQLAYCTCSPELWQPKHVADQSQLSVFSSRLTSFQALVLGHVDTFCSMFQPSVELTKPKFVFHIFIVLQIRTSPGLFCEKLII
jgi:hypothetical protein